MPTFHFSQTGIKDKGLKPDKGKAIYLDAGKPGLGLRVTHNDKRSYFHIAYLNGNKQTRNNLGAATDVRLKLKEKLLTLKEARDMVDRANIKVRDAQASQAPVEPGGRPFRVVAKEWVKEHAKGLKSEKDIGRYTDQIIAAIGNRRIGDVEQQHVYEMVKKKGATAPRVAMLQLHYAKEVLDYAANKGEIKSNPAASLKPGKIIVRDENGDRRKLKIHQRHRFLSQDEVRGLWHNDTLDPVIRLALQMILVTGQRPGEVVGMHKDEIDERIWIVPAERRGKTNEASIVWLPDLAIELLEEAKGRTRSHDGHFFKSTLSRIPTHDVRLFSKAVVAERAALRNSSVSTVNAQVNYNPHGQHWTPHDLRRTTRTGFTDLGFSREDSERALGHKVGGVEGNYDRSAFLPQQEEMFTKWEARLQGWVN